MATPCNECGYPLQGNETVCPECGCPIDTSASNPEPPKGGNGLKWILIIIAVIIFLAVTISSIYLYNDHKEKQRLKERAEQARLDSIEEAEIEEARLAAIRKDSLDWVNFSTPDLAFIELHGHVKSCKWIINEYDNESYTLNEDGTIESYREAGEQYKIKRNDDGQIVGLQSPWVEFSYKWSDDRPITKHLVYCEGETAYGGGADHYHYDDNGLLSYSTTDGGEGENGEMKNCKTTYSNYKFDKMGNWISRSATKTSQVREYGFDWQNEKESWKETRKITYYEQKKR